MLENELKNKIRKRVLTNIIDLFSIFLTIAIGSEFINYYVLITFGLIYYVFMYKTGYTVGTFFTKYKLYWYGKKSLYIFIKRDLIAIFFFFLHTTIYPLKYNLCGQYSYDVMFKTYFNNKECNKNEFKNLTELNSVAFNLRWTMLYFFIIMIIIALFGKILEYLF